VAYPYRDNYPSKNRYSAQLQPRMLSPTCRANFLLNAVGDIDKGSLAERDERSNSATFNTTTGSNCVAVVKRLCVIQRRLREECRHAVALGHWSGGRLAAGGVVHIAS